jgi:hypothetical protein
MVDDQCETYTVGVLQQIKANHERWVESSLRASTEVPTIRVRRIKGNSPSHLVRLVSGRDIMAIVQGSSAHSFDHDEIESEAEASLIAGFLQEVQDWSDVSGECGAGERVQMAFALTKAIGDLERAGFVIFGGREIRLIEGGVGPPSEWPVAIVRVLRADDPQIVKLGVEEDRNVAGEGIARNSE